jgi:hypothetical protein
MARQHRILKASHGVVLTEHTLSGGSGPVAVAYTVKSRRTPEDFNSQNLASVEDYYAKELARCQ